VPKTFLDLVSDAKTRIHEVTVDDVKQIVALGGPETIVDIRAADVLRVMGYTNVSSLAGGWRGWNAAGGPVEKS
jgi:3-mercaptopyruvate sulfurtransferase SseA